MRAVLVRLSLLLLLSDINFFVMIFCGQVFLIIDASAQQGCTLPNPASVKNNIAVRKSEDNSTSTVDVDALAPEGHFNIALQVPRYVTITVIRFLICLTYGIKLKDSAAKSWRKRAN